MADPHRAMRGKLLSIEEKYAEAALDADNPLSPGSLVQFQASETLYLGEVESGWTENGSHHIRVRIEHAVDLERAAAIRRVWKTDHAR